ATGAALSFNANVDNIVRCLLVKESNASPFDPLVLYAGGQFHLVNKGLFGSTLGAPRDGVAAFDPTTGQATSWSIVSPPGPPTAFSLARAPVGPSGMPDFFIGGTYVGGSPADPLLAVVDEATGAIHNWVLDVNGVVWTLLYDSGIVYAGGDFTLP